MNELVEQAAKKIDLGLTKVTQDLSERVQKSRRELAARGMAKSSMAIQDTAKQCCQAYDEAVLVVNNELEWVLQQALYITESFSVELSNMGVLQLDRILHASNSHLQRTFEIATMGDWDSGPVGMTMHTKREQAQEAIRLLVRQHRIERPRRLLRNILPELFARVKGVFGAK